MNRIALLPLAFAVAVSLNAQAVLEPVTRTMQCEKAEVLFLTVAPKGDRHTGRHFQGGRCDGPRLWQACLPSGLHEDNSPAVYYALFNDNGEYVMLAGFTGKREIWDMKKGGKEGGNLSNFSWMPNSLAMKKQNLKIGNSPFDRFYQQESAQNGDITAKADKNGVISFIGKDGASVQTLLFPKQGPAAPLAMLVPRHGVHHRYR